MSSLMKIQSLCSGESTQMVLVGNQDYLGFQKPYKGKKNKS